MRLFADTLKPIFHGSVRLHAPSTPAKLLLETALQVFTLHADAE
jgi:hypothetical protein